MKSRDNLYLVQDGDVPLYVLAHDYGEAVKRWEMQIRSENEIGEGEEVDPPHGVQLVAKANEVLMPPWDPAVVADVEPPCEPIDYDTVRELAEVEDALLDSTEYLEPHEVRDLCRELLRLRKAAGGAS